MKCKWCGAQLERLIDGRLARRTVHKGTSRYCGANRARFRHETWSAIDVQRTRNHLLALIKELAHEV